jgi:hypothetical protein
MRKMVSVMVTAGVLGTLAGASLAQQTQPYQPPAGQSAARGSTSQVRTIDCPPAAAESQPRQGAVGTPQGTGTGSGLNAMPSVGAPQQVEGAITSIGSTRTNRVVQIGDLKLEVEPDTVILVGCQPGSMAELKQGTMVKAAYDVKEPNRNVATVIEAQK